MRRRFSFLVLATASVSSWLGCNALLGIESADFDPTAADGAVGAVDGSTRSDAGAGADAGVGAPSDSGTADASDAGPCVDTRTNPHNCGVCGHDCLGGLCAEGACQPVTVATDVGGPFALALDATYVYWTNKNSQTIHRVPKTGGPVEVLFSQPGATLAEGLAISGGEFYFGTSDGDGGGGLVHCPVTGCGDGGGSVLLPFPSDRLDLDNGILSFTATATLGEDDVWRCTLPCTAGPELVASSQGFIVGLTAAPGQVYWSTLAVQLDTKTDLGAIQTIDNGDFIDEMTVSGDNLVYAQLDRGAVVSLRDGGAKRALASGLRNSDHVVVRDGFAFFNELGSSSTPPQILGCPLAGCGDGGVLATQQDDPRGIAVDDTTVFWANSGTNDAGAIMRVAR